MSRAWPWLLARGPSSLTELDVSGSPTRLCDARPGLLEVAASETYAEELTPLLFVAGVTDGEQQRKVIVDAQKSFVAQHMELAGLPPSQPGCERRLADIGVQQMVASTAASTHTLASHTRRLASASLSATRSS